MRLAIADPPYPPRVATDGSLRRRASRWYGEHPDAGEWDEPARHRALLEELAGTFDGWAIATTPDGLAAYGALPAPARILAWVKPRPMPGSNRITSSWEAVILYPPAGRRSSRAGLGVIRDVLITPAPARGFVGAKPAAWTRWVLDGLGYDEHTDTVADLFPGSGAVAAELARSAIGLD